MKIAVPVVGLVLVSSIVALAPAPSRAQAPTPDQAIAEIREMALYARYREALEAAQAYLARSDLDAAQRNGGLEVLATMHIALRDQPAATRVLEQLYARDPGHRLSDPDASPPVLSAFGRARSNLPPRLSIELDHQPPTFTERRPPLIEVRLGNGADAVHELRLRYRHGDDAQLTTLVMNRGAGGLATSRMPVLDRGDAYEVRYVIEALAPSGEVLARLGTENEPLAFTMPEATIAGVGGGPVDGAVIAAGDDLVWLWALIGVVVAGAGVGLTVGLVLDGGGPANGSLDTIQLPLVRF